MYPNPTRLRTLSLIATGGLLLPGAALAGGIELYEVATIDTALASAGYASRAQDPSTAFKNPAGMSLLDGAQVQTGVQLLYGDVSFTPNSDTSTRLGTDGGGNAIGALPALSLFYTQELNEKWHVGFATLSYFGLLQNYEPNWVGRYYVQEGGMVGVSLMPTISYEVNEWLSVGAGLNAMYGYFKTEVAVNNLDPRVGDGQLDLKDNTWGFGANVGALFRLSEQTRLGVTYLSAVNLDFADTPEFSNLGPGLGPLLANPSELNLGVKVPQSVMLSVFHDLNEKWAVMVDFGWQNWEQFGQVQVGVDSNSPSGDPKTVTTELNYQDTWHGAVGAQYRICPNWRLSTGVAYDSSAVSDEYRTVVLPMGRTVRAGVGAEWDLNAKLTLAAAYEFMWAGDMTVDQGSDTSLRGRVSGTYENANFSVFSLSLIWKL